MRLADSNIWLAMALTGHQFHDPVVQWWNALAPTDTVLFCRSTQQSFLRLLTTQAVMKAHGSLPLSNFDSWAMYRGFRSNPQVGFAVEPAKIEPQWEQLTHHRVPTPKLWMDAYLAAFAISGGYQLVSTDSGLYQFPGLNPIILKV